MSKPDGGLAFPHIDGASGMSLRDYFAAATLSGGLEQEVENDMAGGVNPNVDMYWHPANKIARRAYQIADAMLKERDK